MDGRLLRKSLAATALALAGFALGFPLSWTALFAGALLMAVAGRAPREALARVDWPLLVFFVGLFVVVAGVARAGVAERMHDGIAPLLGRTAGRQAVVFSAFAVAAFQLVSFWAFFRIGAAVTAATLAAGLGLLLTERALGAYLSSPSSRCYGRFA